MKYLNIIAIVFSFLGSLILAFSIQKNPHASQAFDNSDKKKHLTVIDEKLFKTGVTLITIGFGLQLIAALFN